MSKPFAMHPGGWPMYPMRTRWQRFRQRLRYVYWILAGKHDLHRAWQTGHDQGTRHECQRLIVNQAYIAEAAIRWAEAWPATQGPKN